MSDHRHAGAPEWLTLDPGETVYFRGSPSKNLLLAGTGAGMALLVGTSVIVGTLGDVAAGRILSFAALVAVLAILGGIYLIIRRWEYAVTSDRVCATRGLRTTETDAVALADVEEVTVDQSGWQRLINVGDLLFVTDAETLRFDAVENPRYVCEQILARVE